MVKAWQQKKIREYSQEEKKQETGKLINYLLALLGISTSEDKDNSLHYIVLEEFINDSMTHFTYQEIKNAFKMYLKGDLSDEKEKVIHKLDSVVLSRVMRLYEARRLCEIKTYNEKIRKQKILIEQKANELSDEEKFNEVMDGLKEAFEEYKKTKEIHVGDLYLYKFLYKRGLMPKDKTTIEAVKKEAKKKIDQLSKLSVNKIEKAAYSGENELNRLCREISLKMFFDKFTTFEQLESKIKTSKNN